MTFLRHSSRQVHHTVANAIEAALVALGWTDPNATPFGAVPIRVFTEAVIPSDGVLTSLEPGMVAITLGDEPDSLPQELGGVLNLQELAIFVDIIMDSEAAALAVANDVRDICKGRVDGTSRYLPVVDQATSTPVDGWQIELTDVERVRPESDIHWQVVKVTASTYFPDVVPG